MNQRFLRRLLTHSRQEADAQFWMRQTRAFYSGLVIVRIFYVGMLFFFFNISIALWNEWSRPTALQPLWIVQWTRFFSPLVAADILVTASLLIGILALLLPDRRLIRGLVFIAFLMLVGMMNSMGKINHSYHLLLPPALLYIFLPDQWATIEFSIGRKQRFLQVLWGAQLMLLCFYSMSGFLKCLAAVQQIRMGQIHAFHPYALAYQVADRLLQTNSNSLYGPLIIRYPWLGWLPYVATIYFETFAIVAAFRPSLHRLWGVGLIAFHIGAWLTMAIAFPPTPFVLGLILVASPFHPPRWSIRKILSDLPLLGDFLRLINHKFVFAINR